MLDNKLQMAALRFRSLSSKTNRNKADVRTGCQILNTAAVSVAGRTYFMFRSRKLSEGQKSFHLVLLLKWEDINQSINIQRRTGLFSSVDVWVQLKAEPAHRLVILVRRPCGGFYIRGQEGSCLCCSWNDLFKCPHFHLLLCFSTHWDKKSLQMRIVLSFKLLLIRDLKLFHSSMLLFPCSGEMFLYNQTQSQALPAANTGNLVSFLN